MRSLRFPEPKATVGDKPFSAQLLARIFEQIFRLPRPFTGFVKVTAAGGDRFYLFFLQSEAYAAGRFFRNRPVATTIDEFFTGIAVQPAESLALSLFETDPVLLKSMLVFLQEEPTIKAPANLFPLATTLWEIFAEKEDALVVLEREGMCNFFFVKQGIAAPPHLADDNWQVPEGLAGQELILHYVTSAATPVTASIFRSTATTRADDAGRIDRQALFALAGAQPTA